MYTLDIDSAIRTHTAWKLRFEQALAHHNTQKYSVDEISDDSKCVLSSWLLILGIKKSNNPRFSMLSAAHKDFHEVAGQIAELINRGNGEAAKTLIDNRFATLSNDLVELLECMDESV
jgi:hypothetical protein